MVLVDDDLRQASQVRQPQRFGPHVPAVARFMASTFVELFDTIAFLEEIDRRWPGLSFRDYMGARSLVEAFAMKTEGTA